MNKKALSFIGNLLIILVIIAAAPLAILRLFGLQGFCVISGSMEPTITVGSIVCVKTVEFDELQDADIIAFYSGDSVVTHRVVSIDKDNMLITTKGDANNTRDFTPVAYTNVLGKVAFHVPVYGYVATWISTLSGKLIAAGILIIGVALSGLKSSKKLGTNS